MIRRRLMSGFAALSLLATAASASSAAAQNSGTEAEQEACTSDVFRLCQDYIPNEAPIVACLKLNRVKLSPACHQVFYPASALSVAKPHHKRKHRHAE